METEFKHIQSAHCENGVTINLLKHSGVNEITEPLAFGIGAGIFFIYLPFLKVNHGPAIAFRSMPGLIFKRTCRALKIPMVRKRFSSKEKAKTFLDSKLAKGEPVGCQVGVYYLPYYPKEYRFHFNAHNLVVYGKEGDKYLVSDPVMEEVAQLTSYELERVRFAKGPLAPSGQIYYPRIGNTVTKEIMCEAIKSGIKKSTFDMLKIPGAFVGVKGIKYTADKIRKWKDGISVEEAKLNLAQLVRMQEEIGTGGGGFRFIYAAFLQEAYQYIPHQTLLDCSKMFTKSGDLWRDAAVQAAGIYKGRLTEQKDYDKMANYLYQISDLEKEAFVTLSKIKW